MATVTVTGQGGSRKGNLIALFVPLLRPALGPDGAVAAGCHPHRAGTSATHRGAGRSRGCRTADGRAYRVSRVSPSVTGATGTRTPCAARRGRIMHRVQQAPKVPVSPGCHATPALEPIGFSGWRCRLASVLHSKRSGLRPHTQCVAVMFSCLLSPIPGGAALGTHRRVGGERSQLRQRTSRTRWRIVSISSSGIAVRMSFSISRHSGQARRP